MGKLPAIQMAVTMCWWNVVCITPSSWWWGWYGTRDMHARTNEGVPYQSLTTHWSRVARSLHPKLEWGILQLPPCMLHNAKPSSRLHAMVPEVTCDALLPQDTIWCSMPNNNSWLLFFWLTLCTRPKWKPILETKNKKNELFLNWSYDVQTLAVGR